MTKIISTLLITIFTILAPATNATAADSDAAIVLTHVVGKAGQKSGIVLMPYHSKGVAKLAQRGCAMGSVSKPGNAAVRGFFNEEVNSLPSGGSIVCKQAKFEGSAGSCTVTSVSNCHAL